MRIVLEYEFLSDSDNFVDQFCGEVTISRSLSGAAYATLLLLPVI